ncbi:DDE-type integrase/transposase/recombinase, partial [Gilliamella apicola]|uniref:DDE-type integrase/transposase/recombinase n=1 Tax=Gilliamella apicola TaxID=1196095 RepID=UPI002FEE5CE6
TAHHNIVPNTLDRQFNPDQPNTTWVIDITYIKTGEGWLYLSVIIDLYGRKMIARQTCRYIDHHLVCNTLKKLCFVITFLKMNSFTLTKETNVAVLISSSYCYNMD